MSKFLNEAVCRKKAVEKLEEISIGLSSLSNSMKFEKLRKEFDDRVLGVKACLDNFSPEEFKSRGYADARKIFLSRIMESAVRGYYTLRGISGLMEETGLSQINGTAVDFLDRQGQLIELQGIMEQSREFYNGEVQRRLDLIN